ncbi:MAG: response regulator [Terriglobales bacterium]
MKKILVVDDEPCIRELIRDVLEGRGCQVLEAGDAAQALTLCASGHPDLLLVDFALPGANGLQMLGQLRELLGSSRIPAVLMSGYDAQGTTDQAAACLMKPFSASELVSKVVAVLEEGGGTECVA